MESLSVDDAIKKYDIPVLTPAMDEDELKNSSYVLIRHGLSIFNYNIMVTNKEHGEGSA